MVGVRMAAPSPRFGRAGGRRESVPRGGRGPLRAAESAVTAEDGEGRAASSEAAATSAPAPAPGSTSPMQAALEFVARDRPEVFGVDLSSAPGDPVAMGESPETLNGRAAMVGFVGGGFAEVATGQTLGEQLAGHLPEVGAFALFLVLASLAPSLRNEFSNRGLGDEDDPEWGLFTPAAEKVHARVAMVAITVQALLEALAGKPLF